MIRSIVLSALVGLSAVTLFGGSEDKSMWFIGARADIDPKRVHVVDYRLQTARGGSALIFRGNTPVNDAGTLLNYTAWYDTLAGAAKAQAGVTYEGPEKVYIVDICFQNPVMDYQFAAEEAFWKDDANKAKGEFVHWVLLGSMDYPPNFTPEQQQAKARNSSLWDIDQLPTRINKMRQMMLSGPPAGYSHLAIYFHCTHGQDRTGQFANAYRLSFSDSISERVDGQLSLTKYEQRKPSSSSSSSLVSKGVGSSKIEDSSKLPPPALLSMNSLRIGGRGSVAKTRTHNSEALVAPSAAKAGAAVTMSRIYAVGCEEGLRCPMYTFTANAGWYCLWSNAFNDTQYPDCDKAYKCFPYLFCEAVV